MDELFENPEEFEGDFDDIPSSIVYCYGCHGICGTLEDSGFLDVPETEDYIRDSTGRIFAKKICTYCEETIRELEIISASTIENQFQEETVREIHSESEDLTETSLEDVMKNLKFFETLNNVKRKDCANTNTDSNKNT